MSPPIAIRPVVPLDGLADAVAPVIVGVLDGKGVFSRDNRTSRNQTVLRVEGVSETSVVGHVTIGVVGERNGRRDGGIAPYLRILVEVVGRVGVGRDVGIIRECAVSDRVVGVAVAVGTDQRGGEFAAAIVEISASDGNRINGVRRTADQIEARRVPVD